MNGQLTLEQADYTSAFCRNSIIDIHNLKSIARVVYGKIVSYQLLAIECATLD